MDKYKLELTKLCNKYGATFEKTKKGGHYKVLCNGRSTFVSSTPTNGKHALIATEKYLKRMGEEK